MSTFEAAEPYEPDLGPTGEEIEKGAEPDNAWKPPGWERWPESHDEAVMAADREAGQ